MAPTDGGFAGRDRLRVGPALRRQLDADGYLVLRHALLPTDLRLEVERSIVEGASTHLSSSSEAGIGFAYVPMMTRRTPHSVRLLRRFAVVAEGLLGRPVLPMRAKGVRYVGDAAWHRDSTFHLPSLGFLAYLTPTTADTGALRVRPGGHRSAENPADDGGGVPLETDPGDVIVLDEHLPHSSHGGGIRHQWRVDFVAEPQTPAEWSEARRYLAEIRGSGAAAAYDAVRYPTYDEAWTATDDPWHESLQALGAYDGLGRW